MALNRAGKESCGDREGTHMAPVASEAPIHHTYTHTHCLSPWHEDRLVQHPCSSGGQPTEGSVPRMTTGEPQLL
jgi:hypothetical protein